MTPTVFQKIFAGSDTAHGRTHPTGVVNARGKMEVRCWTVRRPADPAQYAEHLAGKQMLGMPPIDSENKCSWGAIDIDEYQTGNSDILSHIAAHGLPLVPFRSKSGGLHVYLFLRERVPAEWVLATLEGLAASLGLSRCEIFPKQVAVSKEDGANDVGNWLNLPYFGDQRWAIDYVGNPVPPEQFVAAIYSQRVTTQKEVEMLAMKAEDTEFKDGPPCLNAIFGRKAETGFRNIALSNLAVYLKKAHSDSWKERLHEYNRRYPQPLDRSEVEIIIKSYSKKEYKYQCGVEPLCRFCDSHTCKKRPHGVGQGTDAIAANRSLTMVRSEPPLWYLDVQRTNGETRRITLTTEQLQSPHLFQARAMEALQEMPRLPGRDEWQQIVAALMAKHNTIELPPEATPRGIFAMELTRFFERASTESIACVLRGMPFDDGKHIWFRALDMFEYMANRKIVKMDQRDMQLAMKDMGALHDFKKIDRKGVNLWKMPKTEEHSTE